MNKNFKYYAIVWAILLAVFHVIVFVSPAELAGMNKFGGAFWSGYIFIVLAFAGQLFCAFRAFRADNSTKLFYNLPLIAVSWTGLVLTLIFGGLCMAIPNLPNWVGIILCFAVLAFTAIAVVKAGLAAEIVEEKDAQIKAKTSFVRSLTVDAESLMSRANTDAVKVECKKVYEAVRYSDPMSSETLASFENEIAAKFGEFSNAVLNGGAEDAVQAANELLALISDRNKKCKLLK